LNHQYSRFASDIPADTTTTYPSALQQESATKRKEQHITRRDRTSDSHAILQLVPPRQRVTPAAGRIGFPYIFPSRK
jgi:hypothetical protein